MQIDGTTFVLEVVNFLALVWILKHFLYRPVLDVLARRRAEVERMLAEGRAGKEQAQALQGQYETRLADWGKEKAALRATQEQELAAERERRLQVLQQELATERARQEAQETHHQAELQRTLEEQAAAQAGRFAARLLERLADPALEARLVDLLLDDLAQLPAESLTGLRAAAREAHVQGAQGKVFSAYPLDEAQRQRIAQTLATQLEQALPLVFAEDAHLVAGLRLAIGPWQLRANLADELSFFAEAANHAN
jgi:F-type H+-transporting ATPase subunit b